MRHGVMELAVGIVRVQILKEQNCFDGPVKLRKKKMNEYN